MFVTRTAPCGPSSAPRARGKAASPPQPAELIRMLVSMGEAGLGPDLPTHRLHERPVVFALNPPVGPPGGKARLHLPADRKQKPESKINPQKRCPIASYDG